MRFFKFQQIIARCVRKSPTMMGRSMSNEKRELMPNRKAPQTGALKLIYNFNVQSVYPVRLRTTSPAMMRPTADGTKAMEPGVLRFGAGEVICCAVSLVKGASSG